MSPETREERALARGATLADRITVVAKGVYHVPSQSDPDSCQVVTDLGLLGIGSGLTCTCPAAEHGNACAHRAAVVLRRQQEARRQMSLRPTVARQPRKQVEL